MAILTTLVPSVSVWNVWDVPLWAWRHYAQLVDSHIENQRQQQKEAARRV